MVYFRIGHTFDGKLFHVSRFTVRDSPHIRLEIISWFTVHGSIFVSDILCGFTFRYSPHIRLEIISWFTVHGSIFVSDILCGYFVRKVEILWFKFIIPVLSSIHIILIKFVSVCVCVCVCVCVLKLLLQF